ncbi:MAG: hypothetical protein FWG87_09785 [Defluviitaleaceae bacterium]|nr:hypothetical protein [Defluviitaleaceae bacterium]
MEIFDIDEVERIALLKMPTLGVETLEYLFKNYNEGAFKRKQLIWASLWVMSYGKRRTYAGLIIFSWYIAKREKPW